MATIIALLLIGYLVKQYHYAQPRLNLERFSITDNSCTIRSPYPRYEWSYRPDEWYCNNKGVLYNPYNGVHNRNHTYNPLGLNMKHSLYGIMPKNQLFYK
jgi:hypothetical protein